MGQIIAIAQGIRNITQQELDDESNGEDSDEDENGKSSMSMAESNRKAELFEWVRFCKEKIEPIDKIWTKRLEDKGDSSSDEDMDDFKLRNPGRMSAEELLRNHKKALITFASDKMNKEASGSDVNFWHI